MAHRQDNLCGEKTVGMQKLIYWRQDAPPKNGKCFVNIHILSDGPPTLTSFAKMAGELRKTFPEATLDEIEAGRIFRSAFVEGFSIITWQTYLPNDTIYEGWRSKNGGEMEYRW